MPTPHRRSITTGLLAVMIALSGCSGQKTEVEELGNDTGGRAETETGDSPSELMPPAEGNTEYPLTLETPHGTTTVEQRPESVALTSPWDLGLLASLDVTPVGAPESIITQEWAFEHLPGEIETVWPWSFEERYPLEQIAQVDTDLLLDEGMMEDPTLFDQLTNIAPVAFSTSPGEEAPWDERMRAVAELLDLSEHAEAVIEETEAAAATYREEHPEFEGLTIAMFAVWGGGNPPMVINAPGSNAEDLFSSFGFAENPNFGELPPDGTLSAEMLNVLDADIIIAYNTESRDAGGESPEFDALTENPLYQELPAVQTGNVIEVSYGDDGQTLLINGEPSDFKGHLGHALNGPDPIAIEAVREAFTPYVEELVK